MKITLFIVNVCARYLAPSLPISFLPTSRVINVCNYRLENILNESEIYFVLF